MQQGKPLCEHCSWASLEAHPSGEVEGQLSFLSDVNLNLLSRLLTSAFTLSFAVRGEGIHLRTSIWEFGHVLADYDKGAGERVLTRLRTAARSRSTLEDLQ
ncbi:MAG: hypothetical protein ACOYON_05040 [Fimbriimonas sp.]